MKCCKKPDVQVIPHGKGIYRYACMTKDCNLISKDVYRSEKEALIALQKFKATQEDEADIIFPGTQNKWSRKGMGLNWNESLMPIIKGFKASFIFFSDLMIKKFSLGTQYMVAEANRRRDNDGPFFIFYFYNDKSEIPEKFIANIIEPTRIKPDAKTGYKGVYIKVYHILPELDFKYFPTLALPFTMDINNKRKMTINLNELYEKRSNEPLVKYKKHNNFRKKNQTENN